MNFTEFIPPVLYRWKNKLTIKEYSSYAKAMDDCTSDAYQNAELCNMVADKTVLYRNDVKEKPFQVSPASLLLLSAIEQYIRIYSKKSLNILSFGGACGVHYLEIKSFLPDISIQWHVVETAQMVKSAMDRGLNNEELSFVSSMEDITTPLDFIHSAGALQYVPDPYEFTKRLVQMNARWVVLNRMMLSENNNTIITIQKSALSANGPGKLPRGYIDKIISYPHTIMSYQKFNAAFVDKGYKLEWALDDSSGLLKTKTERIVGKGFLYVRK